MEISPMGADSLDTAPKILDAVGQLKTGGLILVAFLAICTLVAWIVWIRNKRAQQQDEADAQAAEAESRRLETAAKELRADKYVAALDNLRVEIETMRKDNTKGSQAIQNLLNQHATTLSKTVSTLEAGHTQRQAELSALMRELLDRQKGVINIEDSFRIIEINFRLEIKPSVLATVEVSIRNNHYAEEAQFVEERFLARVNAIIFTAREALRNYSLSVKPEFFFPSDTSKHYLLADELWASLKVIHMTPANRDDPEVMLKRVQQAQLRAENIINSFVNSRVSEIRNNHDDSELRPTGTPGTGSTHHCPVN